MASPPYSHGSMSAISPPYPANMSLPQSQKRRQSDMPSSAPVVKRRKASMLSTTSNALHPLRQTSFPPSESATDGAQFSRSPSADDTSLISGSAVGGSKKKRPRKSKSKGGDDASVVGGAKSAVSGTSGRSRNDRRRRASIASAEDEEEGGEATAVQMVARTQEERQKEIEHRALLVRALDTDQFTRYEAWRSSKLAESVVRRIVNQTLSQSAPVSVILAVKSVAKIFAGEMIEGARKVQSQWMESDEELKEKLKKGMSELPSPPPEPTEGVKETRRGPLEADHLREAHRRYKLSSEGNLVGQLGLWQLQQNGGIERFGTKVGGKRLFK